MTRKHFAFCAKSYIRGGYVRKVYEEIEKSRRKLDDYKMLGSLLF